jgi:putative transport protein
MLDWLFRIAQTSPVAHTLGLIALVCAAGMAVGSLKFKGIGLGSSGVLFMGILAAQFSQPLDSDMLNFVREFGLVLFVFAMGLSLGPGFFASLRAEGLRLNILAAVLILSAGLLAPLVGWLGGFEPESIGGLFAGATTNIPALGAAQQSLASMKSVPEERQALPALACAVAYPGSIVGSLAVILLLKVLFRIDPAKEAELYAAERRAAIEPLVRRTLVVDNHELHGTSVAAACRHIDERVVISRLRRAGQAEVQTALSTSTLYLGDTILAVATAPLLDRFERLVGRRSDDDLLSAPGPVTYRRIAVTNKRVLGKSVAELGLAGLFGCEITRLARGDAEMTAAPGLRLQFGDVVQVVGTEEQLEKAAGHLGNSLKSLNETQFIPLFAGIALGVLVGSVPLVVPGLANPLKLGLAGGPLLVALFLGRIGHFRSLVWHMPQNVNHAFREFGISLFFAALGLAAGDQFIAAVLSPKGIAWLTGGLVITLVPLLAVGLWCRAISKLNFVTLSGLLAGGTTNPPALNFATNLCASEAPTLAYATVYPLTTLLRILVAQVLTLLLCG